LFRFLRWSFASLSILARLRLVAAAAFSQSILFTVIFCESAVFFFKASPGRGCRFNSFILLSWQLLVVAAAFSLWNDFSPTFMRVEAYGLDLRLRLVAAAALVIVFFSQSILFTVIFFESAVFFFVGSDFKNMAAFSLWNDLSCPRVLYAEPFASLTTQTASCGCRFFIVRFIHSHIF
jgi:hypothetical protein